MSRYFTFSAVAIFLLCISTSVKSQNIGDYRSAATGNWNVAATWERFDGVSWIGSPPPPTSADNVITIRSGHTVSMASAVTVDQVVVASGGTLTQETFFVLTLNDGTGTDITVDGTMNFNSGSLGGTGTVVISGTGAFVFGTNSVKTTTAGVAITNNGTMSWSDGGINSAGPVVNTNIFNIASSALWQFAGGVTNSGTINKTSAGTTTFSTTWSNSGTINLSAGTLVSSGTFTNTGAISITNGATWQNNSTFNHNTGSVISGTGSFINSGTLALSISQVFSATIIFSSPGSGSINGTGDLTINNNFIIEGNITGTGALTINGNVDWQNSTLGRSLTIANGRSLLLSTASVKSLSSGVTITNNGTMTWQEGGFNFSGAVVNNSTLTITSNALWQFPGGFTNTGTITKTSAGTTTISTPWSNSGTINLNGGTLASSATFTNTGTISITNGAVWQSNQTFNHNTGSVISGTGSFNNASVLTLNINQVFPATLIFSNTSTINGAGNLTINNDFIIEGTITGTGTLTINGNVEWQNGTLGRSLTIPNGRSLLLSTALVKSLSSGVTITNNGTMTWQEGGFNFSGAVVNNATLNITSNALWQFPGGFTNTGTITKTSTGTTTMSTPWSNSGTINLNGGTLANGSTFTNTGAINFSSGTTWQNNSTFNHNTGSVISGTGSFNNGNVLTLNISQVFSATLIFSSTNTINGPGDLTINNDFVIQGSITGAGAFTVNGNIEWQNGTLGRSLTIPNGRSLLLSTALVKSFTGATLTNNGTMTWQEGGLNFSGAVVNNSVLTITSNALWQFPGGFTNTGTVTKTSTGTTNISTPWSNTGTINLNGGTLTSGNTFTNTGTINFSSGTIWQNSQTFNHNTGSVISGTGSFNNGSVLTLNINQVFPATIIFSSTSTINGPGNLTINNDFVIEGSITGTGSFTVNGNADWQNGTLGRSLTIANGRSLLLSTALVKSFTAGNTITNNGTMTWQEGGFNFSGAVVNNATLNITSNALWQFPGGLTNNGTITKSSTGTTDLSTPVTNAAAGTIKGVGTILFGSTLSNAGTIAPGLSPGILTANGVQLFSVNSTLSIEIAGSGGAGQPTGHDQLLRASNLTLNGNLTVVETGAVPDGDYTIISLTSGTITGTFSSANLPANYSVIYNSNNVVVRKGTVSTWYRDFDGDGFGDPNNSTQAGQQPAGYVANNTDCNDNSAAINPNTIWYLDADNDNYYTGSGITQCISPGAGYKMSGLTGGGDCNDNNVNTHPGATELCDGVDNDCDSQVDEGVKTTFYQDAEGDGFGNPSVTQQACSVPNGYVANNTDCNDGNASINPNTIWYLDADNDNYYTGSGVTQCASPGAGYKMSGLTGGGDCNDNNVNIHPGAAEICNNIDDDCDGQTDEGAQPVNWYQDADGDGFGNAAVSQSSCTQPNGYVLNNTDCNDNNINVHPGVTEVCNGIDDDCDGQIDEGVKTTFYQDADGDGFGNVAVTQQACSVPQAYVANSNDCNDGNAAINPNTIWYLDADNDNYYTGSGVTQCASPGAGYKMSGLLGGGDCNDNNVSIHPGATEICNNVDDDCDGQVDEGVKTTFYQDADGDGFGNLAVTQQACSAPNGYVANNTDCNDGNAAINPNTIWYLDTDNDNYYIGSGVTQCTSPGAGYKISGLLGGSDCNDNNANIHPGAVEICNNIDDDCDGQIDESAQPVNWYRDLDGDGYGNPSVTQSSCAQPAGYVLNNTDCNDNNINVHPGATEVCNGIDDDCDGQTDEGVTTAFYQDADGDGFGNASVIQQACSAPNGYVANNTDCNDGNAAINPNTIWYLDADNDNYYTGSGVTQCTSPGIGYKMSGLTGGGDCNDNNSNIHPGATEICNNTDDDCDGQTDEGAQPVTWHRDLDGDGYGNPSVSQSSCSQPTGYVLNNTDCNDNNINVHPGATEICNSVDDDCDGQVDEGAQSTNWYRDLDGDGYGNPSVSQSSCIQPTGYVLNNTDCNDNNINVHPGATEVCNNVDDDCDGQTDEGVTTTFYLDSDGDGLGNPAVTQQACSAPQGYVSNGTDCNDNNLNVHPGATEVCGNGLDDDCDGQTDEGCQPNPDNDGDGYTVVQGDCNDNSAAIHPGATEICGNNIDDNCNGYTDENCLPGLPILSSRTYPVKEGDAGTTIFEAEVKLDRPARVQLQFNYTTANEDAIAGLDYVGTNGVLIIPAGGVSGIIRVGIIGDRLRESNERFHLNFSNPINVILGDAQSRIMILDDDKGNNNQKSEMEDILTEAQPIFKIPNIVRRNNVWTIPGIERIENEIMVVNTMGQLIFKASNYKNSVSIGNVATGIYFYRVKVIEKDNSVKYYTGRLLITE